MSSEVTARPALGPVVPAASRADIRSLARLAAWCSAVGATAWAFVGATGRGIVCGIRRFVKVPALPYAAIVEAGMLIGLLGEPGVHEPDPFSTESAFQGESWPRG